MDARLAENIAIPAAAPASAAPASNRLPLPALVDTRKLDWPYTIAVIYYHLIALLAFVPWFFSWTAFFIGFAGLYVFGTLGINLCYHRLLTHRGLVVPKWLEHSLAILGICCAEDTPARWVAVHRRHHQHADVQEDPHSPLVNFFWGHMGWLFVENKALGRIGVFDRYAKDILRDKFYVKLERNLMGLKIIVASWAVFFLGGFLGLLAFGGTLMEATQFGLSILVWGVFVRTVVVWHITWSVNSVTHMWGYRNYETDESSRNNVWVGYIASGEGWHNNHHADPRSARHGHKWYEFDATYMIIRLLMMLGLARNVVMPNARVAAAMARGRVTTRGGADIPSE
jgi:stearoyl-CoA desaturase (delta-9 desaturase)